MANRSISASAPGAGSSGWTSERIGILNLRETMRRYPTMPQRVSVVPPRPTCAPKGRPGRVAIHSWILVLASGCIATLLGSGCQSAGKPDASSFASVEIHDRSLKEILETARAVFVEKGYHSVPPSQELVFEQQGGRMTQLTWGGWM